MSDSLLPVRLTRRHFLAGFAVAAAAPIWRGMDSFARAPQTPAFTGDNFGLTHKLLMRPEEILAQAAPAVDPALYDVVVVGAGISGLV